MNFTCHLNFEMDKLYYNLKRTMTIFFFGNYKSITCEIYLLYDSINR